MLTATITAVQDFYQIQYLDMNSSSPAGSVYKIKDDSLIFSILYLFSVSLSPVDPVRFDDEDPAR